MAGCVTFFSLSILTIFVQFVLPYLILKRRFRWYKYLVVVSIAFFGFSALLSILMIGFIEEIPFTCTICDLKMNFFKLFSAYAFSMMWFFVFSLLIGFVCWIYKAIN